MNAVADIKLTTVDRLGLLLAEIDTLTKEADALKDELKNAGEGYYEGNLYRACVTLSQRNVVDSKAIFAVAKVKQSIIDDHTRTTSVITCKVTSR